MANNDPPPQSSGSAIDPLVSLHLPSYIDDRTPSTFFPNPPFPGPSPFMTWSYIIRILATGDLDQLFRDPVCDTAYRAFAPTARAAHGSIENYIRTVRLGWPAEEAVGPPPPNMLDRPQKDPFAVMGSASGTSTPGTPMVEVKETWPEKTLPHPVTGVELRHFVEDTEEGGLVKVIPNDWPYGVPAGATHWCVWSKLPILHPSLFETPDTPFDEGMREELYACITGDGIRGFTGFTLEPKYRFQGREVPEVVGTYSQARLENGAQVSREEVSKAHAWASRHVTRFVEAKWPEGEYETAWFCNPPNLRTVPGLSHFQ
uniref:Uncharacterized protein n=1 Tax=Kalmanozyma brasiliensis (strain GHG001) TaxID=1365824 RepID=V5ERY9_KALBG